MMWYIIKKHKKIICHHSSGHPTTNETLSTTVGTVSTMDFEDALKEHSIVDVNKHHHILQHRADQHQRTHQHCYPMVVATPTHDNKSTPSNPTANHHATLESCWNHPTRKTSWHSPPNSNGCARNYPPPHSIYPGLNPTSPRSNRTMFIYNQKSAASSPNRKRSDQRVYCRPTLHNHHNAHVGMNLKEKYTTINHI